MLSNLNFIDPQTPFIPPSDNPDPEMPVTPPPEPGLEPEVPERPHPDNIPRLARPPRTRPYRPSRSALSELYVSS